MDICEENNVENIVINYKDGTSKTVLKGMVSILEQESEEMTLDNELANISGEEFLNILDGFMHIYARVYGL